MPTYQVNVTPADADPILLVISSDGRTVVHDHPPDSASFRFTSDAVPITIHAIPRSPTYSLCCTEARWQCGATAWTSNLELPLAKPLDVIVHQIDGSRTPLEAAVLMARDIYKAVSLLTAAHMGIRIRSVELRHESSTLGMLSCFDPTCHEKNAQQIIDSEPYYVHVLYVTTVGSTCDDKGGGTYAGTVPNLPSPLTALGKDRGQSLLAHEFGHVLGLGHPGEGDCLEPLNSSCNIMRDADRSDERRDLTLGQVVSAHLHPRSAMSLQEVVLPGRRSELRVFRFFAVHGDCHPSFLVPPLTIGHDRLARCETDPAAFDETYVWSDCLIGRDETLRKGKEYLRTMGTDLKARLQGFLEANRNASEKVITPWKEIADFVEGGSVKWLGLETNAPVSLDRVIKELRRRAEGMKSAGLLPDTGMPAPFPEEVVVARYQELLEGI